MALQAAIFDLMVPGPLLVTVTKNVNRQW